MQPRFDPEAAKCRSYATVERLDKALKEFGFDQLRHIIVYYKTGRVTAVFIDRNANPVIFKGFGWCFG